MSQNRWTPDEIDILRAVYANDRIANRSVITVAAGRLPRHTPPSIQVKASVLGFSRERQERHATRGVPSVRHDDFPSSPDLPSGDVRPALCPNCAHIFTVPADPLAK